MTHRDYIAEAQALFGCRHIWQNVEGAHVPPHYVCSRCKRETQSLTHEELPPDVATLWGALCAAAKLRAEIIRLDAFHVGESGAGNCERAAAAAVCRLIVEHLEERKVAK